MKKVISVLLCLAVLASSVISGTVITSAQQTYDGTIDNYVSESVRTPSEQNSTSGEDGRTSFTGNVALNKSTTVSGLETSMEHLTGDKAVDGISDTANNPNSRWSSGRMKNATTANQQNQTPAWIAIDLGAPVEDITSIKIYYHMLVWATNLEIQTSDTGEDNTWETVKVVTRAESNQQADRYPVETITDVKTLKRHVRFYANTMNSVAGGMTLSIGEIEIYGTQNNVDITVPANASAAMASVTSLSLNEEETNVIFPAMNENYEFSIKGSDIDGIIDDKGSVSPYIIGDREVTVLAQVVNKQNENDRAEKNFTITVHDKTENFPELFQETETPNEKPGVIPAVQEWYGFEGRYTPSAETKFVYKEAEGVKAVADKAKEIFENLGYAVGNVESGDSAGKADIYMQLLEDPENDKYFIGKEGNIIIVNDKGVKIYANTVTGLLYGVYTVSQGIVTGDGSFPYGVVRDYPKFEVRGVMIDIARAPFRLETLQEYQNILSWFKVNEMHMHINDDRHQTSGNVPGYEFWKDVEGFFRLESETFPGLTSTPKTSEYFNDEDGFGGTPQYSKEEWRAFQESGEALGINVITEIDMPGHSLNLTKFVHETLNGDSSDSAVAENKSKLQQAGITTDVQSTRSWELLEMNPNAQNYQSAQNLIKSIFSEYLNGYGDDGDPTFIEDTVHIGADEFWDANAAEKPGIAWYIDTISNMIQETGKKVRMWGCVTNYLEGTTYNGKTIDTKDYNDIELDLWATNYENVARRISEGYSLVNVCNNFLYNNPLRDNRDITNVEHLYESWNPYMFTGTTVATGEPSVLGAKTAVWQDVTDMGVTETDNTERIIRSAAVLCEKTWGGTGEQSYTDFSLLFSKLRYGANSCDPYADSKYCVADIDFANYDAAENTVDGAAVTGTFSTEKDENGVTWGIFSGDDKLTTDNISVSYPYTVTFDIQNGQNTADSKLFSSKDGWVKPGSDGQLSIYRSFFSQNFGYTLPSTAKNITLVGTQEVLKLYVDGEFVKMLGRRTAAENDYNNLSTTFDFPLQVIGDGFVGKLANIKVYTKALSPEIIDMIAKGQVVEYVNVAQNRGAAGDGQNVGLEGWDSANKKLRVGWKAVDGDGNALSGQHSTEFSEKDSFFAGQHDESYVTLDFWREYDISRVTLQWDNPPAAFKLLISSDGKNWQEIENVTGNTNSVTTFDYAEPKTARYMKMQGVQKNSNGNFQLREFMAFEKVDKTGVDWYTSSYNTYLQNSEIQNADVLIAQNTRTAEGIIENPLVEQYMADEYIESLISNAQTVLPEGTIVFSDTNFDGKMNIKDATIIQKYVAEFIGYENVNAFTADVDGNGEINGMDTTLIQKYLVGIEKVPQQ